ncbi:hypothetical protein QYF36_010007 [Acer negundo]|nr:hypothetical protein QYF36_010007 [Acer negundo]
MKENEKFEEQYMLRLEKERNHSDVEISTLKQELEMAKRTLKQCCLQLEAQVKKTKVESEKKLKELESFSKSKSRKWKKKERTYPSFIDSQYGAIQEEIVKGYSGIGKKMGESFVEEWRKKAYAGGSHHSMDDFRHQKELVSPSKLVTRDSGQKLADDVELLGLISYVAEFTLLSTKPVEKLEYKEK